MSLRLTSHDMVISGLEDAVERDGNEGMHRHDVYDCCQLRNYCTSEDL